MLTARNKSEQNRERMVVGIDLGRYSVQISYMRSGMDEPETAEQVTGSEVFNIPMVLCKREGVSQWFYGREAIRYHEKEGGYLVDGILQKAINGESEIIEGESIEAIALLTLFIKRSLSILGGAHLSGGISDIMFAYGEVGENVISVMERVAANLALKNCNIYFQSYAESIYNYMIHQDPEIWMHNVLLSYFDGSRLINYTFVRNLRTTPIVTFVDSEEAEDFSLPHIITEDCKPAAFKRLDENLLDIMKQSISTELFSGVYLLGDGFKEAWCEQSLRFLGRGRRLFIGNDIFSRGACYSLMDRFAPSENAQTHVYLGPDKLKSNIGMNVFRRGEESYLAILDAGINWYDVHTNHELFIPDDYTLTFEVIPLNGGEHMQKSFVIENPPEREAETFRVSLELTMSSVNVINIHVKDLGFGELFPSSDLEWDFVIEV